MGMFNTIVADIACPETHQVSSGTEIQIKWQEREARILDVYRTGDSVPDIMSKYDNTWVRTDYICNACSQKTNSRDGTPYIRTDDQHWHVALVEINNGKVGRVLSDAEAKALGITDFVDDVWPPKEISEQPNACD